MQVIFSPDVAAAIITTPAISFFMFNWPIFLEITPV